MKTYQDFLKVGETEQARMDFVRTCINEHKSSKEYKTAVDADLYDKQQNVTITKYMKLLYTASGDAVPDNYSANYKLCSNFFNRLTTQRNQYLLGNGVTFGKPDTKEKLGDKFDQVMVDLGHKAQKGAVSFGFWNFDHLEAFGMDEFKPLYDEENGALMVGIRFWQIDSTKPLRATLYEVDGVTDYIYDDDNPTGRVLQEKRNYKTILKGTDVDGTYIYGGENYKGFPIIPLFNVQKKSDLVGMRAQIDCYDLIFSNFANVVDENSLFYWTISNCGGMDEEDMVRFKQQMARIGVGMIEDRGAQVEAHTAEVPYASREALIERLRSEIYEDYMALDTKNIASGATTATQIEASYEPLNSKTDEYEACVTTFILNLLELIGIDDKPTYTRSKIINRNEEIQVVLQSASVLPESYITKKILTILGDADALEEVNLMKEQEEMDLNTEDEEETPVPEEE